LSAVLTHRPNPLGCDIRKTSDTTHHDFAAAEWYLTVRCTQAACGGLIAFQKSTFDDDNPNLRVMITGTPSVNCPHCRTLVRFGTDEIVRKRVFVTESDVGLDANGFSIRHTRDS
jgi:hypothetical protein